jgi:hypothetical protein
VPARRTLGRIAAAAALCASLSAAAPAQALDCASFKTAVENASNGQVITLDAGLTCNDTYVLPGNHPAPFGFTIQGGGGGATLDGSGKTGPIVAGVPAGANQLHVTISNLTFRNGTNPTGSGGAIHLGSGDVGVILAGDHFLANKAPAGDGGAVWIQSNAGTRDTVVKNSSFGDGTAAGANTAVLGGAVQALSIGGGRDVKLGGDVFKGNVATAAGGAAYVDAGGSDATTTLTANVFDGNKAGDSGGGATVGGQNVSVVINRFLGNHVHDTTSDGAQGGGLVVRTSLPGTLTQFRNRFDGNGVSHGSQPQFEIGGGGEWVGGYKLASRNDRFTNNTIQKANGSRHAEGAGLGIEGCTGPSPPVTRIASRIVNAVAAGNIVGAGAEGAGVYAGGCSGGPVDLTVLDSTIVANATGGAGATGGLFGGLDDKLTMRNSIVTSNSGHNLSGFGAGRTVTSSDVCSPGVLPGAGNICKFAQLVDPTHGNVHETAASPTIDAGSNASVPAGLKLDIDLTPRIKLRRVDMGAAEYPDPFRGVRIDDQTVTVKNGKAPVRVKCPAIVRGPCKGTLKLTRNGKTLGTAGFSIECGTGTRVPVPLSQEAQNALAANGTLAVVAHATATDGLGATRKSSGDVTLKS